MYAENNYERERARKRQRSCKSECEYMCAFALEVLAQTMRPQQKWNQSKHKYMQLRGYGTTECSPCWLSFISSHANIKYFATLGFKERHKCFSSNLRERAWDLNTGILGQALLYTHLHSIFSGRLIWVDHSSNTKNTFQVELYNIHTCHRSEYTPWQKYNSGSSVNFQNVYHIEEKCRQKGKNGVLVKVRRRICAHVCVCVLSRDCEWEQARVT